MARVFCGEKRTPRNGRFPVGVRRVMHALSSTQFQIEVSGFRGLAKGDTVRWDGLVCVIADVHLEWLDADRISWSRSQYVLVSEGESFTARFSEVHLLPTDF
jgi:hypothetical protein